MTQTTAPAWKTIEPRIHYRDNREGEKFYRIRVHGRSIEAPTIETARALLQIHDSFNWCIDYNEACDAISDAIKEMGRAREDYEDRLDKQYKRYLEWNEKQQQKGGTA